MQKQTIQSSNVPVKQPGKIRTFFNKALVSTVLVGTIAASVILFNRTANAQSTAPINGGFSATESFYDEPANCSCKDIIMQFDRNKYVPPMLPIEIDPTYVQQKTYTKTSLMDFATLLANEKKYGDYGSILSKLTSDAKKDFLIKVISDPPANKAILSSLKNGVVSGFSTTHTDNVFKLAATSQESKAGYSFFGALDLPASISDLSKQISKKLKITDKKELAKIRCLQKQLYVSINSSKGKYLLEKAEKDDGEYEVRIYKKLSVDMSFPGVFVKYIPLPITRNVLYASADSSKPDTTIRTAEEKSTLLQQRSTLLSFGLTSSVSVPWSTYGVEAGVILTPAEYLQIQPGVRIAIYDKSKKFINLEYLGYTFFDGKSVLDLSVMGGTPTMRLGFEGRDLTGDAHPFFGGAFSPAELLPESVNRYFNMAIYGFADLKKMSPDVGYQLGVKASLNMFGFELSADGSYNRGIVNYNPPYKLYMALTYAVPGYKK
ncbi:MAG: hypothetical protein WC492_03420 [Candidatus Micrarchaeia archaeon]